MKKLKINEQWVLQNMVSGKFENIFGNIVDSKIKNIVYFKDCVLVNFKDGQQLRFTVEKTSIK